MCFFSTVVPTSLTRHYVRNHRFAPHFNVRCVVPGCTATFVKWCSCKKHIQRRHRNNCDTIFILKQRFYSINTNYSIFFRENFVKMLILNWNVLKLIHVQKLLSKFFSITQIFGQLIRINIIWTTKIMDNKNMIPPKVIKLNRRLIWEQI